MYRHGLGDCFLLRFTNRGDRSSFNVLIDCGLITVATGPKQEMNKVLTDIQTETQGHLHVVVVTHEHWDHVSGFSKLQAQGLFDLMTIDEVWYGWTEDPANVLGRRLRAERAAKLEALELAAAGLKAQQARLPAKSPDADKTGLRLKRVASLLRFFGIEGADLRSPGLGVAAAKPRVNKTRAAFEYLAGRHDVKTRYIHAKNGPLTLPGVTGVRVFPLGPPEDEGLIKRSSPTKKGQEVYELAGDVPMDDNLAAAFARLATGTTVDADGDGPFDTSFCRRPAARPAPESTDPLDVLVRDTWSAPGAEWRRIDNDWTSAAETLALNLDNHTNNTCLVLAFELGAEGKVLLFAADAQVGNWLSWQGLDFRFKDGDALRHVSGPQLLSRTAFYKVGHHGSHNATLRALGLEQMTSGDLVAFVPVFKEQAAKSGWTQMPFGPLVKRLRERTGGRLVFSDAEAKPPTDAGLKALSDAQRKHFRASLTADPLYYEYKIQY